MDKIRELLGCKKVTQNLVAQLIGITPTYFSKVLNGRAELGNRARNAVELTNYTEEQITDNWKITYRVEYIGEKKL